MKMRYICLAIVCLLQCLSASAGWVQPSGPPGGWVVSIAVNGSDIFVGSYSGVYLSSDAGINWRLLFLPPLTKYGSRSTFDSFVFADHKIFAGTSLGAIFVSADNGLSWTATAADLADPSGGYTSVSTLVASPNGQGGSNLFAGTSGGYGRGIFRSTDDGASWGAVDTGLTNSNVHALVVSPDENGSGMNLFAGTDGGVFLSTNNGDNWVAVNTGFEVQSGYFPINSLAVTPNGSGGMNIFAGTWTGVYLSTNNGTHWTPVNTGLVDQFGGVAPISSIAARGTDLFAGSWRGDVYATGNFGSTWSSTGLTDTVVYRIAVSETNLFAATPTGVWRYVPEINTPTGLNVHVQPVDAATGASPVTVSFTSVTESGITSLSITDAAPALPGGFQLGQPPVYYYITTTAQFAGPVGICLSYNSVSFLIPENLILLHFDGGEWVDTKAVIDTATRTICSTVASLSPFAIVEPITQSVKIDIIPGLSTNIVIPNSLIPIPVGIFSSSSFDATQILVSTVRFGPAGAKALLGKGIRIDLNGDRKSDLLLTFVTKQAGIQSGSTSARIIGKTNSGKWFVGRDEIRTTNLCPNKEYANEDLQVDVPGEYSLEQNYPNPFNPLTVIRYGLPLKSTVVLQVFNTLGQQVALLAQGEQEAGYHEVPFDGSSLASGFYVCRLRVGDFVQTRKLLLVK